MGSARQIAKIAIHPAIGIARVGNSPDEFYFGPEVPEQPPIESLRDSKGRLKRQAARFRVFAYDENRYVMGELTSPEADIIWTVHIANKKAAWFEFHTPLDIPAARGEINSVPPQQSSLRNPLIDASQREKLVIDPGHRRIAGRRANRDGDLDEFAFETGTFFNKRVYLGELRTDDHGRLVVLGGRGDAGSEGDRPLSPNAYTNNDWWYDDVSDGPVDAIVSIGGRTFQAEPAWIIVAPPDYAPGVEAISTGYDVVFQVATELNPALLPKRPKFSQHIHPILRRMTDYQWVNAGFARDFGWRTLADFNDPALIARLNDPGSANRPFRQSIFLQFRDARYPQTPAPLQANYWPAIYGDAFNLNPSQDPRAWMAILETQYEWLRRWADGDFVADGVVNPMPWEAMSPQQRAEGLDRAALSATTGGPFHPGAEFSWPLRNAVLYSSPFRIKRRSKPTLPWLVMNSQIALGSGGPLDGSTAGDLTKWMAVPWHADVVGCQAAYSDYAGDYIPSFWPARVPNDVLTEQSYQRIMDGNLNLEDRESAFSFPQRKKWLRDIVYVDQPIHPTPFIEHDSRRVFINQWDRVGVIVRRPGPSTESSLPDELRVETGRDVVKPDAEPGRPADSVKPGEMP